MRTLINFSFSSYIFHLAQLEDLVIYEHVPLNDAPIDLPR